MVVQIPDMIPKRILVTGGAGFLGSHLCEYFLKKGHEVICMDNLITGSKDNISCIKNKNFQFIRTGYFVLDKLSEAHKLIFNQSVALRDSWAKINKNV